MSEPFGNTEQLPVAWFHEDNEFKFVSTHKDALPKEAIPLYAHPQKELIEQQAQEIENLKSKVQYWKGLHK